MEIEESCKTLTKQTTFSGMGIPTSERSVMSNDDDVFWASNYAFTAKTLDLPSLPGQGSPILCTRLFCRTSKMWRFVPVKNALSLTLRTL